MACQLDHHIKTNSLVKSTQSAYKASHSSESALLKVKNDIHNSIAKGKCLALTLLDLSAAFETINHEILLHRLSFCFGIPVTVLEWFTSYLSDGTSLSDWAVFCPGMSPQYTSPTGFGLGTNHLHIIHHFVWSAGCPGILNEITPLARNPFQI